MSSLAPKQDKADIYELLAPHLKKLFKSAPDYGMLGSAVTFHAGRPAKIKQITRITLKPDSLEK
jgi:hypothetical protein